MLPGVYRKEGSLAKFQKISETSRWGVKYIALPHVPVYRLI